jgi:hypothetical protein
MALNNVLYYSTIRERGKTWLILQCAKIINVRLNIGALGIFAVAPDLRLNIRSMLGLIATLRCLFVSYFLIGKPSHEPTKSSRVSIANGT